METHSTIVKPTNGGSNAPAIGNSLPPVTMPRPSVDPHSLAHKRLSKAVRAVLGAEILDGRVPLMNPTIGMVAQATGVSASYISAARQLSPAQRQDVARGKRSLVQHSKAPPTVNAELEWHLSLIVAEHGFNTVLDTLSAINSKSA
jgi:hypothetical protein